MPNLTEETLKAVADGWELSLAPADINAMAVELLELRAEKKEYDQLFNLQWRRVAVATKHWRNAHPGNETVLPDLGKLVGWLLKKAGLSCR